MKPFFIKKKVEQWYSISEIDKTDAVYRLIIGERSNGKTYSVIKKVIEAWFEDGLPSAYIRRYAEDITGGNLGMLFNPFIPLIKKLSKGKYNNVVYRTNTFTLCYIDSGGKTVEKANTPILYTCAISNYERSKGADRGEIKYFIFDEFMTRASYLSNEFVKFTNVHSSFCRARTGVITYMIANTVNKFCPYFEEMGLKDIEKMKQGEIYLYKYNDEKLTVAVEYCSSPEAKKDVQYYYAFENEALKMIKDGSWEEGMYPHIPRNGFSVSQQTIIYRFFLQFGDNLLVGELHSQRREFFLFFHRFGNSDYNIKDTDLVYTNQPTMNIYWLHSFSDVPVVYKDEKFLNLLKIINRCMAYKKVYFATNSIGEIVRNFVLNPFDWMARK